MTSQVNNEETFIQMVERGLREAAEKAKTSPNGIRMLRDTIKEIYNKYESQCPLPFTVQVVDSNDNRLELIYKSRQTPDNYSWCDFCNRHTNHIQTELTKGQDVNYKFICTEHVADDWD